jgi:hypothetical protein
MLVRTVLCSLILLVTSCAQPPASSSSGSAPPLEGFTWLVGCWLSRDGVAERWERSSSDALSGSTLIPSGEGSQVAQSLRIATTEDARVVLTAQIDDRDTRSYALQSATEESATFVNAQSSDVRSISYRRVGSNLVVLLETEEGQRWQTNFVPCAQ